MAPKKIIHPAWYNELVEILAIARAQGLDSLKHTVPDIEYTMLHLPKYFNIQVEMVINDEYYCKFWWH